MAIVKEGGYSKDKTYIRFPAVQRGYRREQKESHPLQMVPG